MARNKGLNFKGQFGSSFGSVLNIFRGNMNQGMKNAKSQMDREQKGLLKNQKNVIRNQQKQAKQAQAVAKTGEPIDSNVYGQQPYPIDPDYNEDIIYGDDAIEPAYEAKKRFLYGGL